MGVPLFLLITGYLILNKDIKNDKDVLEFYKNNLIPILITTEIWIIIYNVFNSLFRNQDISIKSLIKNMFFIENTAMNNMWYMPMIIGIYIVTPFLGVVVKNFSIKSLKVSIVVLLWVSFIRPTVNIFLKYIGIQEISNVLDVSFLGGTYRNICYYGIFD